MLKEKDIKNGNRYYFVTDYSDYEKYTGTFVTIVRPLEDGKEIDKADVGPMWLAKTEDGFKELNVYLDELYINENAREMYEKGVMV